MTIDSLSDAMKSIDYLSKNCNPQAIDSQRSLLSFRQAPKGSPNRTHVLGCDEPYGVRRLIKWIA